VLLVVFLRFARSRPLLNVLLCRHVLRRAHLWIRGRLARLHPVDGVRAGGACGALLGLAWSPPVVVVVVLLVVFLRFARGSAEAARLWRCVVRSRHLAGRLVGHVGRVLALLARHALGAHERLTLRHLEGVVVVARCLVVVSLLAAVALAARGLGVAGLRHLLLLLLLLLGLDLALGSQALGGRFLRASHLWIRGRLAALHPVDGVRAGGTRWAFLCLARGATVVVGVVLFLLLLGLAGSRPFLDIFLDRYVRVWIRDIRLRRIGHDVVRGTVGRIAALVANGALRSLGAGRGAAERRCIILVAYTCTVGCGCRRIQLCGGGVLSVAPGSHASACDGRQGQYQRHTEAAVVALRSGSRRVHHRVTGLFDLTSLHGAIARHD